MKKTWIPVALLLAASSASFGAVKVLDTDVEAAAVERQTNSPSAGERLVETGDRPGKLQPVKGGTDVPLKDALKRLAPTGWKGYARNVDLAAHVSWKPADSWVEALESVLDTTGYAATIDWGRKRVLVANGTSIREASAPAAAVVRPVAQERIAVAPAAPATSEVPTAWDVSEADGDLQALLTRWVRDAKWQLSWEVPNKKFPVEFAAMFPGRFEEAVKQVLRPYGRGSEPIKGCIYDNHVLRIVPKPVQCELD